jgi:hypothetical protein
MEKINLASSVVGNYTVTYSFPMVLAPNITTTVNGSCKGNNRKVLFSVCCSSINATSCVDKFEVLVLLTHIIISIPTWWWIAVVRIT